MRLARNVVFDFGGVLVEWQPERILASQFPDAVQREIARRDIFGHPDWLELDRGALTQAQAVSRFATRSGFTDAVVHRLFNAVREALQPKLDTVAVLRALAARRVPLYGLSNMPAETYDWLCAQYDFFALFDGVVISGRVGMTKPDDAIYSHLAREHGLLPAESLFIDDVADNVLA